MVLGYGLPSCLRAAVRVTGDRDLFPDHPAGRRRDVERRCPGLPLRVTATEPGTQPTDCRFSRQIFRSREGESSRRRRECRGRPRRDSSADLHRQRRRSGSSRSVSHRRVLAARSGAAVLSPTRRSRKRVPKSVPDSAVLSRLNRTGLSQIGRTRPPGPDLVMKGSPVRVRASALTKAALRVRAISARGLTARTYPRIGV